MIRAVCCVLRAVRLCVVFDLAMACDRPGGKGAVGEPETLGMRRFQNLPRRLHVRETRSHPHVQGNCTNGENPGEPDPPQTLHDAVGAALLPLKPAQCLLVLDRNAISMHAARLWLDNIYFAAANGQRPHQDNLALSAGIGVHGLPPYSTYREFDPLEVYATNVTVQGAAGRAAGGRIFAFAPMSRGASVLFQGPLPTSPMGPPCEAPPPPPPHTLTHLT